MEIWKKHTEYPEIEVSNYGNIRNSTTKKIRKQSLSSTGYLRVCIKVNGKIKTLRTNRLVASIYVDNPNNYDVVMHLNDIKTDNRAVNLKYGTHSENLKGRIFKTKRLKIDTVKEIKRDLMSGELTHIKIAEKHGTSYKNVSNINTGFRHK